MIPQYYTIDEGRLHAGEYPGALTPDAARARLRFLIDMGVRTFIDLTTPADTLVLYEGLLAELANKAGVPLQRLSFPIPDMRIPGSVAAMREIMRAIRQSMQQAPAVYIHCMGGIGRTGTVVGCWLRECGDGPDAAVTRVQRLYSSQMLKFRSYPESPQTREQRNYIRHWQPDLADHNPQTS